MTKQEFISYLLSPEKLNGNSIAALEKLVHEYPYFQMGRMLYLKNLSNEKSIDYEKNFHITTAYAPSGKILYNLIKKRTDIPHLKADAKEIEVKALDIPSSPSHMIPEEQVPSSDIVLKGKPIEKTPITVKKDTLTTGVKEDEPDEMRLLEKQMLREAYRTSMTIDLLEQSQEPGNKNQETEYKKPLPHNQFHSFTGWMKIITGTPPESSKETSAVYPRLTRQAKTEIVENYVLEETSKLSIKPKTEFYSADVMAKKSLVDNETFVTETLAKIYLKQGNLPKALRSYEILLIKHPEKVHIFAPLLEKIKNLFEQQKKKIN